MSSGSPTAAGPPDGLIWTARLDDRGQALVLCGEPLPLGTAATETRVDVTILE